MASEFRKEGTYLLGEFEEFRASHGGPDHSSYGLASVPEPAHVSLS